MKNLKEFTYTWAFRLAHLGGLWWVIDVISHWLTGTTHGSGW